VGASSARPPPAPAPRSAASSRGRRERQRKSSSWGRLSARQPIGAATALALSDEEFSLASYQDQQDDLALLEAARLGREVRLIVVGTIATKTYALGTRDGEELSFAATVRIANVEAGEIV